MSFDRTLNVRPFVSRSGEAPREWLFYLDDMIKFAEKVRSYTAGLDQERFVGDSLIYDATLRNLELIGESANHVPEEVRKANSEIAWRLIVATRNRLIHGYLGIDDDTVWSIVQDDLPELLLKLRELRGKFQAPS